MRVKVYYKTQNEHGQQMEYGTALHNGRRLTLTRVAGGEWTVESDNGPRDARKRRLPEGFEPSVWTPRFVGLMQHHVEKAGLLKQREPFFRASEVQHWLDGWSDAETFRPRVGPGSFTSLPIPEGMPGTMVALAMAHAILRHMVKEGVLAVTEDGHRLVAG